MNKKEDLRLNNIPFSILILITKYIDNKNLISQLDNTCTYIHDLAKKVYKTSTTLQKRLDILNKKTDNLTVIECEEIISSEFENNILKIVNNNEDILEFLLDLLKSNFYIGGSFALIFAYMVNKKEYDIEKYKDADIDIYPIGDMDLKKIQKIIFLMLNKLEQKNIKCLIKIKNVVINIVFENPLIPKIQIILHVKKTINEHIEFIDLPITQFTIGYNKLYKTKLAMFALESNIILIDNINNILTYNRIIKYSARHFLIGKYIKYGFETNNEQRIVKIYEPCGSHHVIEHSVDCLLSDMILIQNTLTSTKSIVLVNAFPIDTFTRTNSITKLTDKHDVEVHTANLVIYKFPIRSNLCYIMYKLKILDEHKSLATTQRDYKKYKRYVNYDGDYNYITQSHKDIVNKVTHTYNNKKNNKLRFKDDLDSHSNSYSYYQNTYLLNNNKYNLYFKIFKPSDFSKIKILLLFHNYITYFLKNHKIKKTINNDYKSIYSNISELVINIPNWVYNDGFQLVQIKFK